MYASTKSQRPKKAHITTWVMYWITGGMSPTLYLLLPLVMEYSTLQKVKKKYWKHTIFALLVQEYDMSIIQFCIVLELKYGLIRAFVWHENVHSGPVGLLFLALIQPVVLTHSTLNGEMGTSVQQAHQTCSLFDREARLVWSQSNSLCNI